MSQVEEASSNNLSDSSIFSAVRHGDLERVRYLVRPFDEVEVRGSPAHQFDAWDATPLYYASFTGHEKIIEYLFAHGARCEQRTFDGERCLYGALNDKIKNLLLHEGFARAGARGHDLYLDMLQKLVDDPDSFPDTTVLFEHTELLAHRFLLAARIPHIGRLLDSYQRSGSFSIPGHDDGIPTQQHGQCGEVLQSLLRWAYTGRLAVLRRAASACASVCTDIQADGLAASLNEAMHAEGSSTSGQALIAIEPPREEVKAQMQAVLGHICNTSCEVASRGQPGRHMLCDLHIHAGSSHVYSCHRALLCARSEYFHAMLHGAFAEGQDSACAIANLEDVDPAIMELALRWVYTDELDPDTPEGMLVQTMQLADRTLMEGLKQRCAVLLNPHIRSDSVLYLLQHAMECDVPRLMDSCVRCLAANLLTLIQDKRLAALIAASAETVSQRQDVDSVPLLDDLRFHVSQLHPALSDDEDELDEEGNLVFGNAAFEDLSEREQKLLSLESLLTRLSIEA